MSKITITTEDKVAAINIVNGWIQLNINNGFETDEVRHELARIQRQLERRKQALLNPQPKKARQPKAVPARQEAVEIPGLTENAIKRAGRSGRGGNG